MEVDETVPRCISKAEGTASLLVYYDPDVPLKLDCDASEYGVGAMLSLMVMKVRLHIPLGHSLKVKKVMHNRTKKEALCMKKKALCL